MDEFGTSPWSTGVRALANNGKLRFRERGMIATQESSGIFQAHIFMRYFPSVTAFVTYHHVTDLVSVTWLSAIRILAVNARSVRTQSGRTSPESSLLWR